MPIYTLVKKHEGAALSSYALGAAEHAIKYAEQVIEKLCMEDTLDAWTVLLKSLTILSRHNECISKGVSLLHSLGFDLPSSSPTKETITEAMSDVDQMLSEITVSHIVKMPAMSKEGNNAKLFNVLDSFYTSCVTAASPFLPLAACTIVKHTLEHGICHGSITGFATYGQFKVSTTFAIPGLFIL